MEPQLLSHPARDRVNSTLPPFPAPTKTTFIPRGLGNAYRRIEAKLRHSRSMDMTQQLVAFPLNSNPGARTLRSHPLPRPDSPASTHSGSSPETGRRKAGMDIDAEGNARLLPFPNRFTQPASDEVFLTVPNRRAAAVIPYPLLPSQSQLAMAKPVSSSPLSSFDSHISTASSRMGQPGIGLDTYSSSFCAGAIAAHAAVADTTFQPPLKTQLPATSSLPPLSPTPTIFSYCQSQKSPQSASCVKTSDVSSLRALSDGLDAPLPPVERPLGHPACLIPGSPSLNLTAVSPRSASTPFHSKFSIEGVPARLSPAIITRQPQHPILSLPPISSTGSPVTDSRRLRIHSLRSVPALPMEGSEDLEHAEHHNAALDDLEEEQDGVFDDDEDAEPEHADTASEDGESISSQPSSEPSRPSNLPAIDVSPLDLSFVGANINGTIRRDDKTPKDSRMSDYFTSKLAEQTSHSPMLSSRPFPTVSISTRTTPALPTSVPSPSVLSGAWVISGPRVLPTPTTPTLNMRPRMYHQASRSMCDMSEILKKSPHISEVVVESPKSPLRNPVSEASSPALDTEEPDTKLGPSLRRQLSMPTFGPSSAPPPYPQFRFGGRGPTIQPRDEEGHERLPHYTNDIYLRAIMPRKMEFSAPGVQARDRKWRRILCVLEGTAFRVYKCPPTVAGKGLIGNLWEKTVGVGDIAIAPHLASPFSDKAKEREQQERDARQRKLGSAEGMLVQSPTSPTSSSTFPSPQPPDEPEAQSSSSTRSRLLPSNFRRKNRNASDKSLTSSSEFGGTHHSFASDSSPGRAATLPAISSTSRLPSESNSPALSSPRAPRMPRGKRRCLWVDDPTVPRPQEQDLLHSYALNNAESGLGSDYVKRRNVIRVRAEGQQFLLQARDIASVVDWIEGFQAAANIALDLDERPMPKGPLFPRRRRRRAQAQATSS